MTNEPKSTAHCKHIYLAARSTFDRWFLRDYNGASKFVRNLDATQECDHIYILESIRTDLKSKIDAAHPNGYSRILKYKNDYANREMIQEITDRNETKYKSALTKAVWTARGLQCKEMFEDMMSAMKWVKEE